MWGQNPLPRAPKDGHGLVMATSFGEQLRAARESRGVTLRQISDHTRIPMRYLEAIENNDYRPLPGGIFNRSFIKKYANYIDFDEVDALEGYSRTSREQGNSDEVNTSPRVSNVYTDTSSNRSPFVTLLMMAGILAILSLGVYAALHWYQRRGTDSGNTAPIEQQKPGSSTSDEVGASTAPKTAATAAAAAVPVSGDFKIQVKAVGLPVWVEMSVDDAKPVDAILQPGNTRQFSPTQKLGLKLAKINTNALEVSVNGRVAKLPYDTSGKGNSAEIVITRDDYAKYLQ
jgi:cytoskeleton protein RodZ